MADDRSNFDVLRTYVEANARLSETDLALLQSMFVPATLRAGEFFLRAGDVAKHTAFVARGCLRRYAIDPSGKEHTLQFAPETWWTTDNASLLSGAPSQYFIEAIEDSELLLIDVPSHEQLVERVPAYSSGFRQGLQRHVAANDQRMLRSMSASAQERYEEFLKTYASIATRVPQWMVASYLGVSPETLSRIRSSLAHR